MCHKCLRDISEWVSQIFGSQWNHDKADPWKLAWKTFHWNKSLPISRVIICPKWIKWSKGSLDPSYKLWNHESFGQFVTDYVRAKRRGQHIVQPSTYCVQGSLRQCFTRLELKIYTLWSMAWWIVFLGMTEPGFQGTRHMWPPLWTSFMLSLNRTCSFICLTFPIESFILNPRGADKFGELLANDSLSACNDGSLLGEGTLIVLLYTRFEAI